MNFRYPNITAGSQEEQIYQLKGFLYNLVEQLNLQEGGSNSPRPASTPLVSEGSKAGAVPAATPRSNFNQIKDLIIKSADIIAAYSDQIQENLSGVYVAQSDFGTYTEKTDQQINANSKRLDQIYKNVQTLIDDEIATEAYVRQGLLFYVGEEKLESELGISLDDGVPVYGLEVGQEVTRDGKKVFDKFARFTSYGATFYDQNRQLAAYITNNKLYTPNVVIENTLTRGGYVETISADGGRVERWVGV